MTTRLKEAIEKVQKLPEEKQDWLANLLLEVLEQENVKAGKLPLWLRATPEERVAAFDEWVDSHAKGTGIPLDALRRVNLYG